MLKHAKLYQVKQDNKVIAAKRRAVKKPSFGSLIKILLTVLFLIGMLILAFSSNPLYAQKIVEVAFIVGSLILLKYLGEKSVP